MDGRIQVVVFATDSVSMLGTAGQLRTYPGIALLEEAELAGADVAVVVVDRVDAEAVRVIRAAQRQGSARVVVIEGEVDAAAVFDAVEAGACGFIRRCDTRPETLVACVRRAAAGDGTVPPDLLGRLLDQVGMAQRQVLSPRGLSFSNLTKREIEVLRLLADGHNTAEVARELVYSERTVKNVLADVTRRLSLRNRTHAVAYALRQGLI
jgi:DNA-binding NarL/FixJ family response regulator